MPIPLEPEPEWHGRSGCSSSGTPHALETAGQRVAAGLAGQEPAATRAIGRRTPAEAFRARPKATPALPAREIPRQFRVRRDKVDITGVITLRHNSRLHHIGLGRRLTA
jgi:hypothetical protein